MLPTSADSTDEGLAPGALLGKYRVTARLGEGAMGVVYAAVHERLGRAVAIKVLRRELSENTELSSRFQMEAELVTRIGHPNIVAVYDFGRLPDGCLYYVMEKIGGESLRARLQRGPLTDQEIVDVFGPLLSALRAAHEIGVVHRDLKPDNVMLLPAVDGGPGGVKLLDFGIAKIRDEQPNVVQLQSMAEHKDSLATAVGAIMGTPAYMSPEQIKSSSSVDKRADIYALGIMLYEALAGQRPFVAASSGELLGAHLYVVPEPPSTTAKAQKIPPRQVAWPKIDPVVLRAIAKEPADRYQDCAALQLDLEAAWGQSFALVRGAALGASAVSLSGIAPVAAKAAPQSGRRRLLAIVAGSLLLVGTGGGLLVARGKQAEQRNEQRSEQAVALISAAQSAGGSQQRLLMEGIAAIGGRAHLPIVAQALGVEDPTIYRPALQAARLLAQPGDGLLDEPLQQLASQAVGAIAVEVAAVQLRLGEAAAQGVLRSTLQSPIPTPEVRLRAALALAQAGALPATALRQVLAAALRAGSQPPSLRHDALLCLTTLKEPEVLRQLATTAESSSTGEAYLEAVQILALAKWPQAANKLRQAATSASGVEKLTLAAALAEAGDKHGSGLLLPFLKDPDPKLRQRALLALGRLGSSGHLATPATLFSPLLSDADPQVALLAAVALVGSLPPQPGPPSQPSP